MEYSEEILNNTSTADISAMITRVDKKLDILLKTKSQNQFSEQDCRLRQEYIYILTVLYSEMNKRVEKIFTF